MTDSQIKEILTAAQDYMLNRLPETECRHDFSPKFRRTVKKLIEREKHPIRYILPRIAAAGLLLISLSGGLLIGFNEEVRADVMRWIAERFEKNEYRYQNGIGQETAITRYTLADDIPVGYHCMERLEEEEKISEVYMNEDGEMLYFTVLSPRFEGDFYVMSDERESKDMEYIEEIKADLYISADPGESNVIVWRDKNGVLFSIQGILGREQMITLAEKFNRHFEIIL